jgi:hypothetical protein
MSDVEYYSPAHLSVHVSGQFTRRVWGPDGVPEEQIVEMNCRQCGAYWRTACLSGMVRGHIDKFARVHAHADPFGTRPG